MHPDLVTMFRTPTSGEPLCLESAELDGDRVRAGWLRSVNGRERYPIRDFIPRFVSQSNYADNFGLQWNRFRRTQLDSHSGQTISADRFWKATRWEPRSLADQWVLDCGCGAGRFAEIALAAGARVMAVDYSNAVDACYANLRHHPNLHVVQADIYALPFAPDSFPYVYSLGVLQHTPNVARAFASLPPLVASGGRLCADFYRKCLRTMLHVKYLVRPLTKRMNPESLLRVLQWLVPALLPVSQAVGRIPVAGIALKRLFPLADYSGIYPLTPSQLEEWALLDTFDMLAPAYDQPQTASQIRRWFAEGGMGEVEVLRAGHLVGRGRKVR